MAKKRSKAKRKRPKRRTAKRKRSASKKVKKPINPLILIAVAVIVLLALAFSTPSENNGLLDQEEIQESIITEILVEYPCQRDSECFLINCKSTPDVVDCVNALSVDTYYENCEAYWDVEYTRDYTRCSCVDGFCK